jgi:hypothetical protein
MRVVPMVFSFLDLVNKYARFGTTQVKSVNIELCVYFSIVLFPSLVMSI